MNDPAYYEKMSTLLDEIITARKARAMEYEEYLKRIAELARTVEAGVSDDTPEQLKSSPGLRALYNNLTGDAGKSGRTQHAAEAPGDFGAPRDQVLELALKIDAAVKRVRPDGWRGVQAREQVIKHAMYTLLRDVVEVERLFLIVKAQKEY